MANNSNPEEAAEREHLTWRSRELLLRTRVLQLQLMATKQANEATKGDTQSTSKLIASMNFDNHGKLASKMQDLLRDKQIQVAQLYTELNLAKSQIFRRTKELIRDLWSIYPIIEFPDRRGYSICDIHLPSSEHFEGHDENMVSVAVGYVGHLLLLLSEVLGINLRFPLRYYGSKSVIYCNRKNQLFPLFVDSYKSRDWLNFSYGMSLLNLDIVQIRTLYGLPTSVPDETLANLHGLKLLLDTDD